MTIFPVLLGVALLLAPTTSQAESERTAAPVTGVDLYTIGEGASLFERYGHSIVCVTHTSREHGTGALDTGDLPATVNTVCFDFGVFSERSLAGIVWGSLQGEKRFLPKAGPFERMVDRYRLSDRSIWRQHLPLSEAQAASVSRELAAHVAERREYAYHPHTSNCSTKIRDIVSRSVPGLTISPPERGAVERDVATYRDLTEQGLTGLVPELLGVLFFVGSPADRATTAWDRALLPLGLRELVAQRLNAPPHVVYARSWEPLPTSRHAGRMVGVLFGISMALALLYRWFQGKSRRAILITVGVASGLVGTVGLVAAASSVYPELRQNWVLLLAPMSDFGFVALTERHQNWYLKARLTLASVVVALSLVGWIGQPLLAASAVFTLPWALETLLRRIGSRKSRSSARPSVGV